MFWKDNLILHTLLLGIIEIGLELVKLLKLERKSSCKLRVERDELRVSTGSYVDLKRNIPLLLLA